MTCRTGVSDSPTSTDMVRVFRIYLLHPGLIGGVLLLGCTGLDRAYDVHDQPHPRVQCESEWQGDMELSGDEEIKAACTRACRSHAREDFEEAAVSCQSVFRLIQNPANFGTYGQCSICADYYEMEYRSDEFVNVLRLKRRQL